MPDAISAAEWQLFAFFEVEPTRLDADPINGWPYNNFTYDITADGYRVTFSVAPAYLDFTLTVERNGYVVVSLSALGVLDIRYHAEQQADWLELLVTQTDRLELRLRPRFQITGGLKSAP